MYGSTIGAAIRQFWWLHFDAALVDQNVSRCNLCITLKQTISGFMLHILIKSPKVDHLWCRVRYWCSDIFSIDQNNKDVSQLLQLISNILCLGTQLKSLTERNNPIHCNENDPITEHNALNTSYIFLTGYCNSINLFGMNHHNWLYLLVCTNGWHVYLYIKYQILCVELFQLLLFLAHFIPFSCKFRCQIKQQDLL